MVDDINTIEKRFMNQLRSTVQLPGSKKFEKHILMHSCIPKKDFSLAKQFQKHLSKENRKNGVIDQRKYRKIPSKRKFTYREYHVQYNTDVSHKYVKMYYDKKQPPILLFFGPHPKPHGERGGVSIIIYVF